VVKNGFISISNRGMMVLMAMLICVALFSFFIHYCVTDDRCIVMKPPVISRLLYIKQINVRIFIMLSSFYGYSCVFFNVRVNYKRFASLISPFFNKLIFVLGLGPVISQPMLGVFDQHEYFRVHVFFATTFFTTSAFYLIIVTTIMERNR
jgi:hypothetical protein